MSSPVTELLREGFRQFVVIASVPLIVSAGVSIVVSLFQAATQLQEQTAPFLIRIVTYGVALFLCAPAIGRGAVRFTVGCFQSAAALARNG